MMNRAFFLIMTVFFLCSESYTQNYTPIIINGEVFFKTELETSNGFVFSEITVANFEKINGVLYNRVFFKVGFDPDMLIGHLREEPSMGRLFFRPLSGAEEFLVYDISLNVGDQVDFAARWCDGISENTATVVEVIETEGAREVIFDRQIGLSETCVPLRFLEGVGPNASVIFPYFLDAIPINGTALRLCHASHQNIIYYPANATTDFCGLEVPTSVQSPIQETLILFPNPVKDHVFFTLQEDLPVKNTFIYNAIGQLVWRGLDVRNINISLIPTGLYYLVINTTSGHHYSGRFVKE